VATKPSLDVGLIMQTFIDLRQYSPLFIHPSMHELSLPLPQYLARNT